jgi:hypothetical protein
MSRVQNDSLKFLFRFDAPTTCHNERFMSLVWLHLFSYGIHQHKSFPYFPAKTTSETFQIFFIRLLRDSTLLRSCKQNNFFLVANFCYSCETLDLRGSVFLKQSFDSLSNVSNARHLHPQPYISRYDASHHLNSDCALKYCREASEENPARKNYCSDFQKLYWFEAKMSWLNVVIKCSVKNILINVVMQYSEKNIFINIFINIVMKCSD